MQLIYRFHNKKNRHFSTLESQNLILKHKWKYYNTQVIGVISVSVMNFPSFSKDLQKVEFLVTSSGMVVFFHYVKIWNWEKKPRKCYIIYKFRPIILVVRLTMLHTLYITSNIKRVCFRYLTCIAFVQMTHQLLFTTSNDLVSTSY